MKQGHGRIPPTSRLRRANVKDTRGAVRPAQEGRQPGQPASLQTRDSFTTGPVPRPKPAQRWHRPGESRAQTREVPGGPRLHRARWRTQNGAGQAAGKTQSAPRQPSPAGRQRRAAVRNLEAGDGAKSRHEGIVVGPPTATAIWTASSAVRGACLPLPRQLHVVRQDWAEDMVAIRSEDSVRSARSRSARTQ